MKKISLSLIIVIAGLAATQNIDAKIWRVNNNPGKSCNFTTLTAALRSTNVNAGDTIHIEGSVTEYGKNPQTASDCDTIRKQLVIIGPGYQLSDNAETQHNKESAKVRTLHIVSAASGTVIAGIEQVAPTVAGYYTANYGLVGAYKLAALSYVNTGIGWADTPGCFKLRIEADNVIVSHCKLFYVDLFNKSNDLKNITITKCFFNPGVISACAGDKTVTNLIISNNFFRNEWNYGVTYWSQLWYSNIVMDFRGATNYSINVNTFAPFSDNTTWLFPVINPTIQNNTFYSMFNIVAKGCQVYNNLFFPTNAYYNSNTPQYHSFGLYQNASRPHVVKNNTVYNGVYWTSPATGGTEYNGSNYGGMLPGVDGNQYSNIAETNWFVATTTRANQLYDKSYVLGASSPARDASNDETKQRGMYGGLSPYVLSGLYTIPAVWEITIPSYPSGEVPSTGFEVRVKVKSH